MATTYRLTRLSEYCILSVSTDEFATASVLAYLPGALPVQASSANDTDILISAGKVVYTIPYTAVDWENCDPIVTPATVTSRTEAMATIASEFVKESTGIAAINNFPTNYPDSAVLAKLNAGLGVTNFPANYPDSAANTTLNSILSRLNSGPRAVPTNIVGSTGTNGSFGGIWDSFDCEGMMYFFNTAPTGGGSFKVRATWDAALWAGGDSHFFAWKDATTTNPVKLTAVNFSDLGGSGLYTHLFIPSMGRQMELTPSVTVTAAASTCWRQKWLTLPKAILNL